MPPTLRVPCLWAAALSAAIASLALFSGVLAQDAGGATPCPNLSKELIAKFAVDNTVLLTTVDSAVLDTWGFNWIKLAKEAGITYYFVAAMDPEASVKLAQSGVDHCFNAPHGNHGIPEKEYKWGDERWRRSTWRKAHIVEEVQGYGFNVISSDLDVIWFKDPLPYFKQYSVGYTMLLMEDDVYDTNDPGDLQPSNANPHSHLNTGIFYISHDESGRKLMTSWTNLSTEFAAQFHDQDALNAYLRGSGGYFPTRFAQNPPCEVVADNIRQMRCVNGSYVIGMMPLAAFSHSYSYNVQELYKKYKLDTPYALHLVWGGHSMVSKWWRIREAGMFRDPPEYYSEPLTISFDLNDQPEVPLNFNKNAGQEGVWYTGDMVNFHLKAAAAQLRQLYYALGASLALNRTLIMPKFQCWCAKHWYTPDFCRINGEPITVFPFTCPMGHLLSTKAINHNGFLLPGADARKVPIREHSFLENRAMPAAVRDDVVVVTANPFDARLATPKVTESGGKRVVQVKGLLDDDGLRAALDKYKLVKRLHLTNVDLLFTAFRDVDLQRKFDEAISKIGGNWCCWHPDHQKLLHYQDGIVNFKVTP